jgi:hypothetical protein
MHATHSITVGKCLLTILLTVGKFVPAILLTVGISNKPSDGINLIFPTVVAPGGPGDRPTDGKARNKGSSPATGPKQWTTRIGLGRDEGTIILIPSNREIYKTCSVK